ncbi:hypothetical protein OAG84_03010 [Akkermansiaceae bacterium]|nr:hypothetical protein [Akkermansiaceae bacterium]
MLLKTILLAKMKQYIAAGASIFLASCSQSDSDREVFKLGGSKEERRERNAKREEGLLQSRDRQKEQAEARKATLQQHIEELPNGSVLKHWSHKGISDLLNRKVPKGLPGEGLKYYDELVVRKKGDIDFGWELEATLDIASCDTGPSLYGRCFEASLWKDGNTPEPPLHTWDLVQTRIQHTKELMKYLMELAGDVSDESEPSKFNYTVIVQNPQIQNPIAGGGSKSHELGRRVKRCEKYGLAHLPYVEGVLFKYWWYGFNKQRQM